MAKLNSIKQKHFCNYEEKKFSRIDSSNCYFLFLPTCVDAKRGQWIDDRWKIVEKIIFRIGFVDPKCRSALLKQKKILEDPTNSVLLS